MIGVVEVGYDPGNLCEFVGPDIYQEPVLRRDDVSCPVVTEADVADGLVGREDKVAVRAARGVVAPGHPFGIEQVGHRFIVKTRKDPRQIRAVWPDQWNRGTRSGIAAPNWARGVFRGQAG